ncbi:VanW family protein [Paracrocinitomix mangrovi]|uniref:VanW family protein n=1 Tax=Paracrocinitomix mangrovi TaxID=2862509 RepID=UPI001C8EDFBA|nr:VanW family protein [Paracrocinitomix mangrovi]UKN01281.1 VanW family protein [Paracrocinitomix mangrovi]
MKNSVDKPIHRSKLRRSIGKEYFCIKQKVRWWTGQEVYAREIDLSPLPNEVVNHSTLLLRKLKDVDMYLQHNKIVNLRLAASKINGIIIEPGQTFSFWKTVGRPTKRKGYVDGLTLSDGKIGRGVGGGLCQMGNLIYWMSLHTPLTVQERWRHGYDVFPDVNRKLPFGSGATLSYNYVDLQLKNETQVPFQINLKISKTHLQGNISSGFPIVNEYEVFERNHKFELQWWGGYTRHNQIWRRIKNKVTTETTEELVTENHAIMMYNPLIGQNT